MSKHILNTTLNGKPVQVVIGWDRPLKQYFYQLLDISPNAEAPVLASSMNLDQAELYDVDPIIDELQRVGITVPQQLIDEVQADEVNGGSNRVMCY